MADILLKEYQRWAQLGAPTLREMPCSKCGEIWGYGFETQIDEPPGVQRLEILDNSDEHDAKHEYQDSLRLYWGIT